MNAQNLKTISHSKEPLWAINHILQFQNVVWPLIAHSASSWCCTITPQSPSHYTLAQMRRGIPQSSPSILQVLLLTSASPALREILEWDTPLWYAFPLTWDLVPVWTRTKSNHHHKILSIQLIFFILTNFIHGCNREIMRGFVVGGFVFQLFGQNEDELQKVCSYNGSQGRTGKISNSQAS